MMSKPEVMMLYPMRPKAMEQLESAYIVHRLDLAEDKAAFLLEHGKRCRAVATNGHAPLTREMLTRMPALELVACSSAGFESLDVAAMAERGVRLSNSSMALCDDVADCAILLMMAARRSFVAADAYVRSGDWARKGMFPLQTSLKSKVLGIVGLGTIGNAIARRGEVLGLDVRYWSRTPKDAPWTYVADLKTLAEQADNLVVIVAGGKATQHLISREIMEALGPEGLLINVSRGSVVDEEALIDLLESGGLGGAALDVYASEPDPNPRLTALSNVTLFPHHASGTVETRDAMAQLVVDNLKALFANRDLVTPVDLSAYLPQRTGA